MSNCQWVKSYLLKGRSLWHVNIPSSPSWTWRKLLQLRPLIQSFFQYQIGDGSTTSLWYDNWHPLGPLVAKYGTRIIYDSSLTEGATVSDILNSNSQWNFPVTQTWELNEIREGLPTLLRPNPVQLDGCKWTLTQNGVFTISSLWDQIRTHWPVINWNHIVWFSSHIPKCSLISWLAIHNKLSTSDRLVQFGVIDSSCCSFCTDEETHDHLFFNCPYTKQVWDIVSLKSQFRWHAQTLASWVSHLCTFKGKGLSSIIAKLSFTVTLYHVWIERNTRKFQNVQHPVHYVVNRICNDIRNRLLSLTKIPVGSEDLRESWSISVHPSWLISVALNRLGIVDISYQSYANIWLSGQGWAQRDAYNLV